MTLLEGDRYVLEKYIPIYLLLPWHKNIGYFTVFDTIPEPLPSYLKL